MLLNKQHNHWIIAMISKEYNSLRCVTIGVGKENKFGVITVTFSFHHRNLSEF